MLDFLCKRRERDKTVPTDEVEPFQLQLLCQNLETKIRQQQKTTVRKEDLGGETGMSRVLQNFYDDQINKLGSWRQKRKVRQLCENGLISATDRRLSLAEEDIAQRFHAPQALLNDLVNSRLLRAEPRVNSVYYELSHDALVKPIQASQKKLIL